MFEGLFCDVVYCCGWQTQEVTAHCQQPSFVWTTFSLSTYLPACQNFYLLCHTAALERKRKT